MNLIFWFYFGFYRKQDDYECCYYYYWIKLVTIGNSRYRSSVFFFVPCFITDCWWWLIRSSPHENIQNDMVKKLQVKTMKMNRIKMFINMMNRTRMEKKDNIWSMFVVDVFCFGSIRKHFFRYSSSSS